MKAPPSLGEGEKEGEKSALPLLQTRLYKSVQTLSICLNDLAPAIGSVEIDNHTTLSDLREKIMKEFDAKDLPDSFRIMFSGAPTGKAQESSR